VAAARVDRLIAFLDLTAGFDECEPDNEGDGGADD
jgi:hypothetical protein